MADGLRKGVKAWNRSMTGLREWEPKRMDGTDIRQVHLVVLARSQKEAAATIEKAGLGRCSVGYVRDYMGNALPPACADLAADLPPGSVIIGPDGHGTVLGQTGYVVVLRGEEPTGG